jgi:hypothetical protein
MPKTLRRGPRDAARFRANRCDEESGRSPKCCLLTWSSLCEAEKTHENVVGLSIAYPEGGFDAHSGFGDFYVRDGFDSGTGLGPDIRLHVYTRGANFYECLYTSLPSATRRHRVARHNASSIRISQARKYPSDGIGGIAAFIDEVAKLYRRGQMRISAVDPDAARFGCFTTTFSMRTLIGSRSSSARRNQQ